MMALRTRADGRKTAKKKPGRKPTSASSSDDRDLFIFIHALHLFPRLREIFFGIKTRGPINRELAKISIMLIEGSITEESDFPGHKRIKLMIAARASGRIETAGQLDATADLLIKKHRAIMKDRDRKEDRDFLDKHAMALHIAMAPREATKKSTVVVTPMGVFGASARNEKRANKEANEQYVRGETPWETVARVASTFQINADVQIKTAQSRACADLAEIGFPINQILQRLNLHQNIDIK